MKAFFRNLHPAWALVVAVGIGVCFGKLTPELAEGATLPNVTAVIQGQTPTLSQELLVGTSSTLVPALTGRRAIELQNLGPNTIYCALSATPVLTKSRRIQTGESWALDLPDVIPVRCIAATAAQVTGAATIVTQTR